MKPKHLSEKRPIFENDFLSVYSVIADFGSFKKEYFVTDRRGGRVGTIVLDGNNVLLVRQYRFLINGASWELPGGGLHPGESAEDAAKRECEEEASVVCKNMSHLFEYEQGVDVTQSRAVIFECKDFEVGTDLHPNEETDDRAWVPYDQCVQMILDGEIKDSMTIMALLMHHRLASLS